MSLKAKLVSSVAAFCLVLALLVVGILAVPSATINMSGTISFQATDVNATVVVTVSGTVETIEQETFTYNADSGEATVANVWETTDWTFGEGRLITVTIVITNNDTARDLEVAFTAPTNMSASNVTVGGSSTTSTTLDDATTGAGTTNAVTYTITFAPANENLAVSAASWSASVALTDPSVE